MDTKFNKPLYILMFSIHGLVRHENMELGRDADTGGQVKYVVELGEHLGNKEEVARVDLFTRLISDERVSGDYSQAIEDVTDNFRIVRIQCGGKKYMRKELLWPYMDEFIDKTIKFVKKENRQPDIIHGHYPDAGYVAMHLSEYFGAPFIFTGHSLGRPKKQKLLTEGMPEEEINKVYKIDHRISVEEEIIKNSDTIITSTSQEIEKQYGMYENKSLGAYSVIPPGVNLDKFYSYYYYKMPEAQIVEESIVAHASLLEELNRFFINPEKPLILALCRADKRKNISGLVETYGRDKDLQAIANLAIFAGIRKDITSMEDNEQDVLTRMLLLMDKFDLYGKMAIPKKHDFTYEVPELYRIAAEKKGVFVNVAYTEPFGLTLIEASACGVPIVATNDGGPQDIIANCQNGILVDPNNREEVAEAIKSIIVDQDKWKTLSTNGIKGVREHYSWDAHCTKYLTTLEKFLKEKGATPLKRSRENPIGNKLLRLNHFVITDIDDTLIGDSESLAELLDILKKNDKIIGFGIATGRSIESASEVLDEYNVFMPDILITSVGSEIYYKGPSFADHGWKTHISKRWDRKEIKELLDTLDFLEYQEEENQRQHKISYYMTNEKDNLSRVHDLLRKNNCHYNLVYSDGQYLDILPYRASKGKAIRYISYKWEIPLPNIMVCGDSGNDEEMLKGGTSAVVVANHEKSLDALKKRKNIYFSRQKYASGVIEGLKKYNFIERAKK